MPVDLVSMRQRYAYSFDETGFSGTLLINSAAGVWDEHANIRMILRKARPDELVGSTEQDVSILMILAEDVPAGITNLKTRDRIRTDQGKELTFTKSDWTKRQVQGITFALEAKVQG